MPATKQIFDLEFATVVVYDVSIIVYHIVYVIMWFLYAREAHGAASTAGRLSPSLSVVPAGRKGQTPKEWRTAAILLHHQQSRETAIHS